MFRQKFQREQKYAFYVRNIFAQFTVVRTVTHNWAHSRALSRPAHTCWLVL